MDGTAVLPGAGKGSDKGTGTGAGQGSDKGTGTGAGQGSDKGPEKGSGKERDKEAGTAPTRLPARMRALNGRWRRIRARGASRCRPRALSGRWWWTACALAALATAAFSTLGSHRVWGAVAAAGYAAAAWLSPGPTDRGPTDRGPSDCGPSDCGPSDCGPTDCGPSDRGPTDRGPTASRGRRAAAVAASGAALLPLLILLATGRAQLEVEVVARSASLLLATGSPYVPHPEALADFDPYLPGMAFFGIPEALFGAGPLTDPRVWTGAAFLAALAACGRGLPPLWTAACPLVALPLAVGGVDLPVVALMCLGLTLAGRGRAGGAGLVLGLAAALKWTAWPALPVCLVLLRTRSRRDGDQGSRPVLRCAVTGAVTVAVLVLPVVVRDPAAFLTHVVAFPLGLTDTVSTAASPLPGHLLATRTPDGRAAAVLLLAVSALLLAVSLVVRPPGTVAAAASRLALGLLLALSLMPASRFGYLVYPLVLAVLAAHRTPLRPEASVEGAPSGGTGTLPRKGPRCPARSSSPMTSRRARAASRPSSRR
ncbi:glycosyltransferase 87 family protein [Streptomyces sp. NPDC058330]|uniref:glycosyltransferase 87 family protein n=1 Tax=Streptomyces sp. NPDC058330 TaxID=3346449 RepID=UPI0036EAB5DF